MACATVTDLFVLRRGLGSLTFSAAAIYGALFLIENRISKKLDFSDLESKDMGLAKEIQKSNIQMSQSLADYYSELTPQENQMRSFVSGVWLIISAVIFAQLSTGWQRRFLTGIFLTSGLGCWISVLRYLKKVDKLDDAEKPSRESLYTLTQN